MSQSIVSFTPLAIVLTSALAVIPISLSGRNPNLRELWTFLAGFLKLMLLFSLLEPVTKGIAVQFELWKVLPGVSLHFSVDAFGLLFAFVACSLWIPTSLYVIGYMRGLKEHAQTRFFACFALALSATAGVAFAGNLLTLYVFYEILSLSTFPLVAHHQDGEARTGGRKYLTYLLATSIGLVLPAMIITYQMTGTLEFSSMGIYGDTVKPGTLLVLLLLFLYGFAKSGLMPLHSWLPGAMVAPTPVSALLHAVAVVKVGVFCNLRVITGIFGIEILSKTYLDTVICVIAGVTVIVSSLIALSQDNLKRRLAFSTVGQLSYIILGAGLAQSYAVKGAMLHISMHAFGKITLFMCAGAIFVASGKKYISQMVGLGHKMPFTFGAFLIGSLSVIGLPPAGGFISKWLLLKGTIAAEHWPMMVVLLGSSLLNAAYFFPIVYQAFFGKGILPENENVKEAPLACTLPLCLTAVISIVLFVYPEPFLTLATLAVGE
ncbi:MAG: monovalent cation/H+ antiporter subunit D family protein [bacterium]|nr:monovalent cation/H+ antiporter subunit D family protein [bacterium]